MKIVCKCLIIISLCLMLFLKSYEEIEFETNKRELDIVFSKGAPHLDYIGYIEIKRLGIKREIVLGITEENLNKNHVTLSSDSKSLESDHIVLAGHSVRSVFLNLHNAIIGDLIEIITYTKKTIYQVYDIQIVEKTNVNSINEGNMILITCMNDNNKRLLIKAKKI